MAHMIIRHTLILILLCLLTACGSSGSPTNSAPEFPLIEEKDATTNNVFRLELQGTDLNGDEITYSANGDAGDFENPFTQLTPAVFDTSKGIFEWTPTNSEIGKYSVEFTVTENTPGALSSSIVVEINVDTIRNIGEKLFTRYCAQCHGVDGTGMSGPDIRLKTNIDIVNALTNVTVMQNLTREIDQSQINVIAFHILTQFSGTDFHSQFDLSNGCVVCHNGIDGIGKGASHINSTYSCQACHNTNKFRPIVAVDHNHVIGTCSSCHNGVIATAIDRLTLK